MWSAGVGVMWSAAVSVMWSAEVSVMSSADVSVMWSADVSVMSLNSTLLPCNYCSYLLTLLLSGCLTPRDIVAVSVAGGTNGAL